MVARTFHFLVAALVVANPICCQMFGAGPCVPKGEEVACESDACQGECPCRQSREGNRGGQQHPAPPKPCDCPSGSYCQCLPAGAIVKEVASLEIADDVVAVLHVDVPPRQPESAADFPVPSTDGRAPPGKACPGRVMRCWNMSLIL